MENLNQLEIQIAISSLTDMLRWSKNIKSNEIREIDFVISLLTSTIKNTSGKN